MTSPETLNTKVAVNEVSFPLVTHTVYSDAQFNSYGILNSGRGAGNFLDSLDTFWTSERSGFKGRRYVKLGEGCLQIP
jgi:hypothetical protein